MLKPSKLSLRWDESWKVAEEFYDSATGIPATHAVLRSKVKGKQLRYAVHCHMPRSTLYSVRKRQHDKPIAVGFHAGRQLWWYADVFYEADTDLTVDDVVALVHEADNKRRLKLEKAHALMAMRRQLDSTGRRQPIPQEVKLAVWQRDGGRCVQCESQLELEYDHIIPLVLGGSNTERNLQLLCATCNRRKGGTLG